MSYISIYFIIQKPTNHMHNIVTIITERASDLAAMDKVVYHFSPRVSIRYFIT
jgi:Eukaryotic protein of unknown function (DUF2003).